MTKEPQVVISIRVDASLKAEAERLARAENRTLSNFLETLIMKASDQAKSEKRK